MVHVCTAAAARLWLLFVSYVFFFFNPLTFSLFVSYSFLYYLLSVFLAYFFVPFFLLSACFWGKEAFHWTLAGNPGWGFCSLLRPVRQ